MKSASKDLSKDYLLFDGTIVFLDWSNDRMKIVNHDCLSIENLLEVKKYAIDNKFGKIISFLPASCYEIFCQAGFEVEGRIRGFFSGVDALCYTFFVDQQRSISRSKERKKELLVYGENQPILENKLINRSFEIRKAVLTDAFQMTALFKTVFETYPSPVFDTEYIKSTIIGDRVRYKVAIHDGKIVGISSADMDSKYRNAEMTDCVTNPLYRGQGILKRLLQELEKDLEQDGFTCLYSLSRVVNPAVNSAFERMGYIYSGCMINNCNICGAFEDMNVWVKQLK